ncbi:MAG: alkyl hydroperoxide reductase [Acidobacteria bacterium]|nr:MAG: alkyl hydroperoxide reductase [Acidobacteriota bacterium]
MRDNGFFRTAGLRPSSLVRFLLALSLCLTALENLLSPRPTLLTSETKSSDGKALLSSQAPEWSNQEWINSKPLRLCELKGKVVLLRFFMESTCPMCSATAPSLNYFYSNYRGKGLVVVGMYTPKPHPANHPASQVRKYVGDYKFEFPVALDNDWKTLRTFWLDRVTNPAFTSASFLIDKKGIIRFIHPGGEYSAASKNKVSQRDFADMEKMIEKLLSE